MGQKVNAIALRIGDNLPGHWRSIAYAKHQGRIIVQDQQIRTVLAEIYSKGQIGEVLIERQYDQGIVINIYARKSATIVGKGGKIIDKNKTDKNKSDKEQVVERLKKRLAQVLKIKEAIITLYERIGEKHLNPLEDEIILPANKEMANTGISYVTINIYEIAKPDLNAKLLAENVVSQIENRVSHKNAMKKVISNALKQGAQGVMVRCSGRLGGAELARVERYKEGRVPLHTLRANIDYAFVEALTTYGKIGVKVWVYK